MKYVSLITIIVVTIVMTISFNNFYINYEKFVKTTIKNKILISNVNTKYNHLLTVNKKFKKDILKLEQKINNSTLVKVTVTYYCPWAGGTNSDSNPNKTALMTTPKPGYTIAISKSLVEQEWLGHKVYIDGFGIGRIEDRMNKKIKGNCIDICIGTEKAAFQKGKRYNINMVKLND